MIYLNREAINITKFPDNTSMIRVPVDLCRGHNVITWQYEGDHECFLLWELVHHIRNVCHNICDVDLVMQYVPNARMDRSEDNEAVFSLKWFAEFINFMNFNSVKIHDPHSIVAPALIDRCIVKTSKDFIANVLLQLNEFSPIICYPDDGATKKYSKIISLPYISCKKKRDWATGKINDLVVQSDIDLSGKNILIVDDICSKGGTFIWAAKKLKECGANKVFLAITHCENTIEQGEIFTTDYIEHVFTTDSICSIRHEKLTIGDIF